MSKGIVVCLFDYTGNFARPWVEAGYTALLLDKQHNTSWWYQVEPGMYAAEADLTRPDWARDAIESFLRRHKSTLDDVKFACFWPPCTDVAVSGSRWFRGKGLRSLERAVAFFATSVEVAEWLECPYLIENPVTTMSTYWRPPDHKFHPCHYSGYVDGEEFYTKETWLWTGGPEGREFKMPPRDMGDDIMAMPDTTYIHHQPPGEERANIRSATPMGFARACYLANCGD